MDEMRLESIAIEQLTISEDYLELYAPEADSKQSDLLEDVSLLKKQIKSSGIVLPLTVNQHNVVVCGNRRLRACRELVAEGDERFKNLTCIVKEFDNPAKQTNYYILSNHTRNPKSNFPETIRKNTGEEFKSIYSEIQAKKSAGSNIIR